MTETPRAVKEAASIPWSFIWRVLIKAFILFAFINIVYVLLNPLPLLGRLSLYNSLFPGRLRLPYGDDPGCSFNITLSQLEAMFASHEIQGADKSEEEFRVLLIGDSSIWGFLLEPGQTLSAQINQAELKIQDGRTVRSYNLGYPTMSVTKDLLILERGLNYDPDLIIWLVTLESLPRVSQIDSPFLQLNPERTRELITRYTLDLDPEDERFADSTLWGRTIFGQRRELAQLINLQMLGVLWAGSGVDLEIPETYNERLEDLPADLDFHNFRQGDISTKDLAIDVLEAGLQAAGNIPVVFINEPVFISQGENSDIRYNFYYPRWAYDFYREELDSQASARGWYYVDLWDALPSSEFTDSAIHYTPLGSRILAQDIIEVIKEFHQE
ncbi:MAG TPA: hypothetical protein VMX56_03575 [Anaerolineales bacterium]|nr:hypothetical protein [Anaerolineales bacterium]